MPKTAIFVVLAIALSAGLNGCKAVSYDHAYCKKDWCDFVDPVGTAPTDPRNPVVAH